MIAGDAIMLDPREPKSKLWDRFILVWLVLLVGVVPLTIAFDKSNTLLFEKFPMSYVFALGTDALFVLDIIKHLNTGVDIPPEDGVIVKERGPVCFYYLFSAFLT